MANRGENLMKKFQSVVLVSLTAMFCLFSTAFAAAQTIISVTAVNFGVVVENTTSATKTVTLKNTGTSSITISSLTGTTGTPYSILPLPASTCLNSTLAAGKSCTVELTFSPLTTGSQPATLTITTTALINGTRTASLSGTGIAPTWLSSPSISFSAVAGEDMSDYGRHAAGEFQLHDLSHCDAALCRSFFGRHADDQYRCLEHSEQGIAVRYGDCADLAFVVFDLFFSSSRRGQRPQDGCTLQLPAHAAGHHFDHGSHSLCCIRDMSDYGRHAAAEFQLHDLSHGDAALCRSSSGRLADDQNRCPEHSEHGIAVRYGGCADLAFVAFNLFFSSSRRGQRPQDGYVLQQPAHAAEHQFDHGSSY